MHINRNQPIKRAIVCFSYLFIMMFIIGITTQSPTEIGIKSEALNLSTKVENSLPSAADSFIENRTIFSKNLVNDSSFNLPSLDSPWSVVQTPPELSSDTSASIENQMGVMDIVGDQDSFIRQYNTLNNNSGEWRSMLNPEYPAYPYWYPLNTSGEPSGAYNNFGLDSGGFWTGHKWAESSRQTPSIHWVQNVSITDDMSEYKITYANLSVLINATVSINVDVLGDTVGAGPQAVTYDYADYYVKIADLNRTKIYTLANYRTTNLGAGNPASQQNPVGVSTLADRYLTMAPMADLVFYLTSVLSVDRHNFSIILGIDFHCEDNFATDYDYWNSLRIKALNFTFSYEKQIDKSSAIGFEQNGFEIDPDEYPVDAIIELNNATIHFDYNCSVNYPSISSNSRILIFVNGYEHTESIYLRTINTTMQSVKNGTGFDVTSLVKSNQILQLKFVLYIADDFTLNTSLILTVDNINLTVDYTIIERFSPIATSLKAIGTLARTIQWNDSLTVILNYTEEISGNGITDANFSVDWLQEWSMEQSGDGLYEITCLTNQTRPNQQYFLDITSLAKGLFISQQISIEVNIIGRLTNLNLSLNGIPQTTFPSIQVPIQNELLIWVEYRDIGSQDIIKTENKTLIGSSINTSMYEVSYDSIEEYHIFEVNTSQLGIGTHLITISFNATNFQSQSKQIQIQILPRSFTYLLVINDEDYTNLPKYSALIGESLNLSLQISDYDTHQIISGVTIDILGDIDSSAYNITYEFLFYQIQMDTFKLGLGPHLYSLALTSPGYDLLPINFEIEMLPRIMAFNITREGENYENTTSLEIPITKMLVFQVQLFDTNDSSKIPFNSSMLTISGINPTYYSAYYHDGFLDITINSTNLGLGIHGLGFSIEVLNYKQISRSFLITIAQIQAEIRTQTQELSFSVELDESFLCTIYIQDFDFDVNLTGCSVYYNWQFGSGTLEEIEPGIYQLPFKTAQTGSFTIFISAYKSDFYNIDPIEITLYVIPPVAPTGLPTWILYIFGTIVGGFVISFIAYQRYFKFPPSIRKIHQLKSLIRKGKSLNLKLPSEKDLFSEAYYSIIRDTVTIPR